MWLTSIIVRAVLLNKNLREHLLKDSSFSESDYISFDSLDEEKQDYISENIINVLEAFAPFILIYSGPLQEHPDDARIYGTRGAYMVRTQEGRDFFSRKNEAINFAQSISKVSWDIAKQAGFI